MELSKKTYEKADVINELDAFSEDLAKAIFKFWLNIDESFDIAIIGGHGTGKTFLLEKLSYYIPEGVLLIDALDELDVNDVTARKIHNSPKIFTVNANPFDWYTKYGFPITRTENFLCFELSKHWINIYYDFCAIFDVAMHRLNWENDYVCIKEKFMKSTNLQLGGK